MDSARDNAAPPGPESAPTEQAPAAAQVNLAKVAACVAYLFDARTAAHKIHLSTPNYAAHIALAEWYDAVIDLADQLAEVARGIALGQVLPFDAAECACKAETNPVTLLAGVVAYLDANRAALSPRSEVQNIVDEIQNLTHRAIYKTTSLT